MMFTTDGYTVRLWWLLLVVAAAGSTLLLTTACSTEQPDEKVETSPAELPQDPLESPQAPLSETESSEVAVAIQEQPVRNVLLITLDTLRADHLSCYGAKNASTPNLDALASRGVLFEQAVVQVPLTLPSHASILSGTYPQVHGIRDIGGFVMDTRVPTAGTIAKAAGMETGAFVGAAVLHHRFQLDAGFDTYDDNMVAVSDEEKLPGVVAEVRAEVVTNRAIHWLEENSESRTRAETSPGFLLWVHYYDPHRPYDAPEPFKSRYQDDPYAGEAAYTDAQVGRLLDHLEEAGLQEQTLVVLLSDHGESLGEHGEYTHGVFLYKSTMHVPLIMAGPGLLKGHVVEQQVRSIDILPTIAEFLALSPGGSVQGVSLLPAAAAGKGVRTTYSYMETLYPKTHMGWSELRAVRTEDWKLIISPKPELYRLKKDSSETQNVVDRFPADADRLQKQIWTVAGPPDDLGTIDYQPLDEESKAELKSLGYVSAGIRRELRIDMSGPDPKDRVGILTAMEEVGENMNVGNFQPAADQLEIALAKDPTNPLLYQHLGLCRVRLGQYRRALAVYEKAIEHSAETDETFSEMGEIYIRLGDLPRAAEVLDRSSRRNPTNLQVLTNLATVHLQTARLDEAERVLKVILTQDDRHAMAYNLYGILQIQQGKDALAKSNFETAVQYDSLLAEPYMNLGILAQEAGQIELAVSYFESFLKRANPKEQKDLVQQVKTVIEDLKRTR